MAQSKTVLILGWGSIGKRHHANALALGWRTEVWDPLHSPNVTLEMFLNRWGPSASHVVICSPPEFHVEQTCLCLQRGFSVLCEKPLALNEAGAQRVVDTYKDARSRWPHVRCTIGYQLRFIPTLQACRREALYAKTHDSLILSHSVFSHDITLWNRGLSSVYASRIGILLEASHELDYILWTFGTHPLPIIESAVFPDQTVEQERVAVVVLRWASVVATLMLDYVLKDYHRSWTIASQRGRSGWSYDDREGQQAYTRELDAFLHHTGSTYSCRPFQALRLHHMIDRIKAHALSA